MRNSLESQTSVLAAALCAAAAALLPSQASADVRDYIRWKRNGQLDYRRLLQRYEPVSSFGCGGSCYGYPYAASGGMLWPAYYYPAGYYFLPGVVPDGYYGWGPPLHHY